MVVTYRPVTEKDLAAVCDLPRSAEELFFAFPKAAFPLNVEVLSAAIEARADSTVVEIDGSVGAFANFYRWGEAQCAIGNVMVAPDLRGVGIASGLIKHMVSLAFEKYGAEEVVISCFNDNVAGLLLYKKLGFTPYEIEERVDHRGERVALIHSRLAR